MRVALSLAFLLAFAGAAMAKPTRFWNLTANTITSFELAIAGTDKFEVEQTKHDKDGSVDHDERLDIVDTPTGTYDARLTDSKGRMCMVKNIKVTGGAVFSIEESQLTDCKK